MTPPRFDHLASRPRAYPLEPMAAGNPFPAVDASCALFDAQTVSGDGDLTGAADPTAWLAEERTLVPIPRTRPSDSPVVMGGRS